MKLITGAIFVLAGLGVMGYGAYVALSALGGLYQGALQDAMNQPEGTEKATSDAMIRGVLIALPGVVVFVVGSVLMKVGRKRRARTGA